ncbi:hypothetical protein FRUB_07090 [Fimbriiglobus ruber]|uniref:Uncharacterized protein n=1 Tax=Fimbriiglobus ruber TaxID=1908690 RepID=A0A225D8N9_9BACT|nr:hypothetical protein FRUB_07090 [Fimbriiglobus ruber]
MWRKMLSRKTEMFVQIAAFESRGLFDRATLKDYATPKRVFRKLHGIPPSLIKI